MKKASFIVMGVTALVCSRTIFFFINDPEGPNLLVVVVMAAVLYVISLAPYFYLSSTAEAKKALLAVFTQVVVAIGLYFFLR
jgi:hypothetical protein